MIKNGDAFEIKKTEVLSTEIQLNSSHPKSKLFKTSTLINNHCKNCETWEEKKLSLHNWSYSQRKKCTIFYLVY